MDNEFEPLGAQEEAAPPNIYPVRSPSSSRPTNDAAVRVTSVDSDLAPLLPLMQSLSSLTEKFTSLHSKTVDCVFAASELNSFIGGGVQKMEERERKKR